MSSAIDYLKKEEENARIKVYMRAEEANNTVRDANFWAEVNRIRENGGWRAEEDRISLGNGILTTEQQAELDRDARELIRVRHELIEKKKQEERQKKKDEKRVRELLLSEPALSWKMRVSPNDETFRYWPDSPTASGESWMDKWNPNGPGKSAKEMLDAYEEIQEFRVSSMSFIKSAIKKTVSQWESETDDMILKRDDYQKTGGSFYSFSDIRQVLGTTYKKNIDEDWWKSIVLNEIGGPLYNEECSKWLFYCNKFIERSEGKPRMNESLQQIKQLEEKLASLTKRNEFLEEKINSIRNSINTV